MKAVIVGGGIIGLCSAWYLNEMGWEVVLVDRTDLSDSCSYGNLGMVVPSHFVPLAAPGIVSQGIRWMFNSKSPFYVKPALSPKLISWGLRFIKAANARHVEQSARPLLDLNLLSKSLYDELARSFDFSLEAKGILMYFKQEAVAEEEIHLAEKARALGLDAVYLNKEEVQQLEPTTKLDVLGAVHYRSDAHLYPNLLMKQLITTLKQRGVQLLEQHALEQVERHQHKIQSITAGGKKLEADLFVMASGSWLPDTLQLAGLKIPLLPGKGYSFTVDEPAQKLNIPAILCEARVAITPMQGRMRFGGTMELGKMQHRVNLNRVKGIVESIPSYFPELKPSLPAEKNIWYGFRPCSPDGLPYIGYSAGADNLLIAGGHAMMGLSLGPATGKLIAELANGKQPSINLAPFAPDRFS
ncbi:FAD-dependent oxidoreductase [Flavihumibacter sp. CACIAM 22H1]|uniref:NAD(P)/FAD-dependent oxidoreductase n=1 Tax=Flavihumibacter sp. CACIAM 22H1 TaxID=1812911 RepID=UPI0007A92845|nr:FAD-dependent oxidoreductase [Flavihumibacter sp. CACIAM 22H1]KYP16382.1 MAG: amino acid dehydrogenase [Flavihumibacter sp. CACIAM 22H1]